MYYRGETFRFLFVPVSLFSREGRIPIYGVLPLTQVMGSPVITTGEVHLSAP